MEDFNSLLGAKISASFADINQFAMNGESLTRGSNLVTRVTTRFCKVLNLTKDHLY